MKRFICLCCLICAGSMFADELTQKEVRDPRALAPIIDAVRSDAGSALQPADVCAGSDIAVGSVSGLVCVANIKAVDVAGNGKAESRCVRVFASDTQTGVGKTNGITSLVLTGGSALETVTEGADYRYITSATGTATATLTAEGAGDIWLTVIDGGVRKVKVTLGE